MSVFTVGTYVVRPENREEFISTMNKLREFMAKDRETFRGVKSWRLFDQMFGGTYFGVVELWEFESLAYQEKFESEITPEGKLKDFVEVWTRLAEMSSQSWSIWKMVMQYQEGTPKG